MFTPWTLQNHTERKYDLSTFKVEKLDKIRLLPKAQRKLAATISASLNDFTVKDCEFIDSNQLSLITFADEYKIFIPKLNLAKEISQEDVSKQSNEKWHVKKSQTLNESKIEKSKRYALRETLKVTSRSKSLLESCVNKTAHSYEMKEYPSIKTNHFFFDSTYDLSPSQTKGFINSGSFTRWSNSTCLDPENVLSEEVEVPDLNSKLFESEKLTMIPADFFISDYYQNNPILLESQNDKYYKERLVKITSKWKFRRPMVWSLDPIYLNNILDEPIRKIELKYKLPQQVVVIPLSSHSQVKTFCLKSASKKWKFSKYKTYMMNWKPFGGLQLEDALDEDEGDAKVTISSMVATNDDDRYLKLSDIESNCMILSTCKYEALPVKIDLGNPTTEPAHNLEEIADESSYQNTASSSVMSTSSESLLQPSSKKNNVSELTQKSLEGAAHSSMTDIVTLESQNVELKEKGEANSFSTKRTMSELSSIVLKKRKRENPTQFDFSKRYPYLDVLNQTTGSFLPAATQAELPKTRATSKDVAERYQQEALSRETRQENILETSEIDIQKTILNVPESQICNVMLNVEFPTRFGAAFNQFNNMVEREETIILGEFKMDSSDLEFDMFLNATCGVIFLRPINIYQIDIPSGENLVFLQLSEIAMQVLSLIVVIAVDETVEIENDEKLTNFIKQAEDFGIQIFVVSSKPKTIATSMFELMQKYSVFQEAPFSWRPEHRFLESCGVENPFLAEWILDNWSLEHFVGQSEEERTRDLLRMCTAELANHINQAVQNFTDGDF